jgi:O-methyltransferase
MKEAPYSLLSPDRIGQISELLKTVNKLVGNIAEVGCYKGGIGHYLNLHSNGKSVLLFDTFDGIPMQGDLDAHPVGDFGDSSFDEVKMHFSDSPNVQVIKGVFPKSAKKIIKKSDKFCFVHLDADQYESTKDSLAFFYEKMVVGGIIVFDDWHWLTGVTKAVDEFFYKKQEKPIQVVPHQCYIIKK